MLGMVAQAQKLVAEGISRWIEVATAPFVAPLGTTETIGGFLDPRRLTEEGDRIAEALLISQKELALKVLDAMAAAEAAERHRRPGSDLDVLLVAKQFRGAKEPRKRPRGFACGSPAGARRPEGPHKTRRVASRRNPGAVAAASPAA